MGFRVGIGAQMGGLPRRNWRSDGWASAYANTITPLMGGLPSISRRKTGNRLQIGAAGNNGEHRVHRLHLLIGGLPRIPDHRGGLPRISTEFEDFLVFRWASEYAIVGFRV